ncbi:MAG TPA: hypothetical protein VG872_07230 [Acidimicrobiia bacterium]|jgi:hypothetical protein|nr:hypothetical protein [Acidimicrobiia bacterium]
MSMSRSDRQRSGIGEEVLFEEYMLRRAARSRIETERETSDAVALALDAGVSWARIAQLLGVSVTIAKSRYAASEERAMGA